MIAIIKNEDNTTYVANILALKADRGDTQVITFDRDFAHIVKFYMWKPYHAVYMLQEDNLDFSTGGWQGLDLVINDNELLSKLENGSALAQDYPKVQEYAHEVELPEWFEIKNQNDCDNLISISAGFHDGVPTKATMDGSNMELVIDDTFDCKFTLKFIDIVDMDIVGNVGLIYDSEMSIEDNIVCWKVTRCNGGWVDGVDWEKDIETEPYIKCKKLLWKMEPSNR